MSISKNTLVDCKKSSDFFVLFAMFFIYVQFRCQKINIDV